MAKTATAFLAVVFLIVGGLAFLFASIGRDASPPDTEDLAADSETVPDADNAFVCFAAATNTLVFPADAKAVTDYLDGRIAESPVAMAVVASNAATFAMIETGLRRSVCRVPKVTGFDTPLPYVRPWRNIARAMAAKVRCDRLAGRHADAVLTCGSLLQFGRMIRDDGGSLIGYLVGLSALHMGFAQAQDIARDAATPMEDLARLRAAVDAVGPSDAGLVRAIKVEYRVSANTIDRFRSGENGIGGIAALGGGKPNPLLKGVRIPGYIFQPNKTKRAFASLYRDMIADAPLPYAKMRRYDEAQISGLRGNRAVQMLKPNVVGRILHALLVPAFGGMLEQKCRADCNAEATRLLIACNVCRRNTGALPESLQALAPGYLPGVPPDPYDGAPFRYSAAKRIVYSVGRDLKDSDGSTALPAGVAAETPSKSRWQAEDVVFPLDAAVAVGGDAKPE